MGKRLRRAWTWLRNPSTGVAAGTLLLVGALAAGTAWGAFSRFVAYSDSLEFCTSCHSMRQYVYEEYRQSPHYGNAAGVRAVCADCHVPQATLPKLWRKARATVNEVPKHLMGTIDAPEAFEARRLALAEHVWADMKANDSRECRTCHSREAMLLAAQKPRARGQHEEALASGETCIDCHRGIAHRLPEQVGTEQPEEEGFAL